MNKKITDSIIYVGVNDHQIDLFEGQYVVKNGMAYNSYVIFDDDIAVMDTVDINFTNEWLANIEEALNGRLPKYLIVQHMEPDHSANIENFMKKYPQTIIVGNDKTFKFMSQFFRNDSFLNTLVVKNGDTLSLGKHTLTFVFAPMIHWPEVMFTYDSFDKVLFSADAFGKFGANDVKEDWGDEARRYYIGIVGKYGVQVKNILSAASTLEIEKILPLHGPVLSAPLTHYLEKYTVWATYGIEKEGVLIVYTSIYGNTKSAAELLKNELLKLGTPSVEIYDLARSDMAEVVGKAFEYGRIALASPTYNMELFPYMDQFIHKLVERNFQNKTIGIISNGTWAPVSGKLIKDKLSLLKNITFLEPVVNILSSVSAENKDEIKWLARELAKGYSISTSEVDKHNTNSLFNIGYGLYVITTNDGKKDNGLIVNTVTQLTNTPNRVGVTINKLNYSHYIVEKTKKMNVNILSTDAPFSIFEIFGFQSGRNVDKFKDIGVHRSDNGLVYLSNYINSFMSLDVISSIDLGTHTMFICDLKESQIISKKETMTYTYYQNFVKPKPKATKGYVCKVCGYVYEGDTLPADYICPLCKHGAEDFEKIG
ncbi:MAG: flavin reductase [Bacilli bacterium]